MANFPINLAFVDTSNAKFFGQPDAQHLLPQDSSPQSAPTDKSSKTAQLVASRSSGSNKLDSPQNPGLSEASDPSSTLTPEEKQLIENYVKKRQFDTHSAMYSSSEEWVEKLEQLFETAKQEAQQILGKPLPPLTEGDIETAVQQLLSGGYDNGWKNALSLTINRLVSKNLPALDPDEQLDPADSNHTDGGYNSSEYLTTLVQLIDSKTHSHLSKDDIKRLGEVLNKYIADNKLELVTHHFNSCGGYDFKEPVLSAQDYKNIISEFMSEDESTGGHTSNSDIKASVQQLQVNQDAGNNVTPNSASGNAPDITPDEDAAIKRYDYLGGWTPGDVQKYGDFPPDLDPNYFDKLTRDAIESIKKELARQGLDTNLSSDTIFSIMEKIYTSLDIVHNRDPREVVNNPPARDLLIRTLVGEFTPDTQ